MQSCCRRNSILVLNIAQLQLRVAWKNCEKLGVSQIRTRPKLGPLTLPLAPPYIDYMSLDRCQQRIRMGPFLFPPHLSPHAIALVICLAMLRRSSARDRAL